MRIAVIIINALLVKFGMRALAGHPALGCLGGIIALLILAYIAQPKLWQIDKRAKEQADESGPRID